MRQTFKYRNLTTHHKEHVRMLCERHLAGLQKHVQDFPPDVVWCHGVIEQHPQRELYRVSLTLRLPKRWLSAKEEGHLLEETLREAWTELERQLEKHKAFLRHEHLWRRPARRAQLRQGRTRATGALTAHERELYLTLIQPHLKKLYNFARRKIAFCLATGEVLPGELTPEEVVDAVVLQGARAFASRPPHLPVDRWLFTLTLAYFASEIRRLKAERNSTLHVEATAPADPAKEVATLERDDEIYDFYQPDESVRLEDLVPDPHVPSPEQVVESHDLQCYINQTLAQLPQAWWTAFVLHHVEGFTVPEIAHMTGRTEDDVARALVYTHEFLRQKLLDTELATLPGADATHLQFFSTVRNVDVPEALSSQLAERVQGLTETQ
jgi:RNA polymerase sigma factor (sigma-70 family)